jgi:hypothetical protein
MAIQFENGAAPQSTAQPTASAHTQAQPASQPIIQRANIWSFSGQPMMGAVMAKDVGSEIYAAFKKIFLEMAKEQNKQETGINVHVIDFDNKNYPAMSFSSIIVATSMMTETGLQVAYCPPDAHLWIGNSQTTVFFDYLGS